MAGFAEQMDALSKALFFSKTNNLDPKELIRLEKEFRSDVKDLSDLQEAPQERVSVLQSSASACDLLVIDIPLLAPGSPQPYHPRTPILWKDKHTMKALPHVTHILSVPEFWKKYDTDEVVNISRNNAEKLAASEPHIGEKLLLHFEKELKHMIFIFESLQDSVWNIELKYLNAQMELKRIAMANTSIKRKKQKQKIRQLYKMRIDMVDQKIEVLQSIADSPFEIQEILLDNPNAVNFSIV